MSTDRILLLVGVNGVIISVLAVTFWMLVPNGSGVPMSAIDAPKGALGVLTAQFQSMALRLSPSGSANALQRKLDIAGNPRNWSVDRLFAAKAATMIGFLVVSALFASTKYGLLSIGTVMVSGLSAVAGFYLPDLLAYNSGAKRQKLIQKTLPDTLDLMSVCMRAGLGFDAAIAKVAENSSGPLAEEFARMLQEFRLGESRSSVLQGLGKRSTVADLKHVSQALVQANQLGIPLANVLLQQSAEMRVKRRQRAEEQAQKVTVKVIFPTLLCILPALMSVILGPAVINIYHAFAS